MGCLVLLYFTEMLPHMVSFQSKDGVMSEIDGWFGRSFMSAAVRAAIGSAGSGAAMAGCDQRRVF